MYKFSTDQFGFTDFSFHVLRSKFPIAQHDLKEVESISISRGRQVGNWLVLLLFGCALLVSGAILYIWYITYASNSLDGGRVIYIEEWTFAPLFLIIAGAGCIFYSFKNGWVMTVEVNGKRHRFPLGLLRKGRRLDQLVLFLTTNPVTARLFDASEWKTLGR